MPTWTTWLSPPPPLRLPFPLTFTPLSLCLPVLCCTDLHMMGNISITSNRSALSRIKTCRSKGEGRRERAGREGKRSTDRWPGHTRRMNTPTHSHTSPNPPKHAIMRIVSAALSRVPSPTAAGLPGGAGGAAGGPAAVGLGTRGIAALTVRMMWCFGGFAGGGGCPRMRVCGGRSGAS